MIALLTLLCFTFVAMVESSRPLLAFTPSHGWMNDPNGQFYDAKNDLWHLYYQYNPNDTVWGTPLYWGHATSKDLSTWKDYGATIGPDNDEDGVFSGNIVIDYNNTSGFFNESIDPRTRVVAIYTYDTPTSQTQHVAYSLDGGYTFEKYAHNPVLELNSKNFRDPKMFWHEPTSQWIMVIALSQEFKIQIYGSTDLTSWSLHSNFSGGFYGFQYECPGLVEVPIEGSDESKWVMILAINPGSPLGGSANQYFVGEFDGYEFVPDDHQARLMDYGKDFYAFQTFDAPKDKGVVGLAWASNWQYAGVAPTKEWRSSMTVARKVSLAYRNMNPETKILSLLQYPILGESVVSENQISKSNVTAQGDQAITLHQNSTGTYSFDITFSLDPEKDQDGVFEVISGSDDEFVRAGFSSGQFFVDRGNTTGLKENPFFTDKTAVYVEPLEQKDGRSVYKIFGIIDGNIMEVFVNDGVASLTNTFFIPVTEGLEYLEVKSTIEAAIIEEVELKELQLKS
ncbi:Extracellular exo-inulinase [Meyerozyma sp. JA9]|nr:Extracellular exo-inulinase [Meyerozyma sp. JA9]